MISWDDIPQFMEAFEKAMRRMVKENARKKGLPPEFVDQLSGALESMSDEDRMKLAELLRRGLGGE